MESLPQYLQYAVAFVWGLALLTSFTGWGKAFLRIMKSSGPASWGQEAAYGLCMAVVYGGVLNLTHVVSTQTIVGFVVAGCIYWAHCTRKQWHTAATPGRWATNTLASRPGLPLLAIAILWALFRYGGSVWGYATGFNAEDDFKGYFVLMERLLQEGYLPADPLNARRLFGGLGGHDFLNAMGVSVLSLSNMNLLEPGIATLIALGVLSGNGGTVGGSASLLRFAPALMMLAIPLPLRNVTSMVDGIALLLALYALLSQRNGKDCLPRGNQIIAGLLVATLCTLRHTYVSQLVVVLSLHYIHLFIVGRNWRLVVKEASSVACAAVLFAAPWGIASYIENGTLLYPYTGSGHIAVVEGLSITSAASSYGLDLMLEAFLATVGHPLLICTLIVLLYTVGTLGQRGLSGAAFLPFCLGLLLSSIATEVGTGRLDPNFRYSFPLLCSAYLICLQQCLAGSRAHTDVRRKRLSWAVSAIVSFAYLGLNAPAVATTLNHTFLRIVGGILYGDDTFSRERHLVRRMQSHVPATGALLASLDMPFSLDYRASKVWTTDYPGLCGIGQPMPVTAGPDTVRDYLRGLGITHLALEYYPPAEQVDNEYSRSSHPLIKVGRRLKKSFSSVGLQLVNQSEILYNDGKRVLISLAPSAGRRELAELEILEYLRTTADAGTDLPPNATAVAGLFADLWFSKSLSVTFQDSQATDHVLLFESIGPAEMYPLQLQMSRHDGGEDKTLTISTPGSHSLEFTSSASSGIKNSPVRIDISCNRSFIPAQISSGNTDSRELSMRLLRIDHLDLADLEEHIATDRLVVSD